MNSTIFNTTVQCTSCSENNNIVELLEREERSYVHLNMILCRCPKCNASAKYKILPNEFQSGNLFGIPAPVFEIQERKPLHDFNVTNDGLALSISSKDFQRDYFNG